MQYSFIDFLTLIGSIGLFLYGMKIMSEGLQKIAGDKMRNILSAMTKNRLTGLLTGIAITALIQSSSASTVMVVSFVNAGLMSLADSMAVIMGANVGTTATSWIITLFGFKVNIEAFVLPLIALSIPFMFAKRSKYKSTGEFMIGFALLFMGLELISANVPDLQSDPELFSFLQAYTSMGFFSVLIFLLTGIVLTMIIQSSSAAFAIILVMCSKGWIPFDMACAMVLGSNIGTTVTPIIASLGANSAAKKAALGHLLFNCFGTVWALVLFYPFVAMNTEIARTIGPGDPNLLIDYLNSLKTADPQAFHLAVNGAGDPDILSQISQMQLAVTFGLAIFHTSFNVINVLIMIWFTKYYVLIADKLIKSKGKEDEEFQLKYISSRMVAAGELNISQAQNEIIVYAERVNRMFDMVRTLKHTEPGTSDYSRLYARINKYEDIADRMEIEIAHYLNHVANDRLSFKGKMHITAMLNMIGEIESIADSCNNLARTIDRQHAAGIKFHDMVNENIDTMFNYLSDAIADMLIVLRSIDRLNEQDAVNSYNKEQEINNYRNELRAENTENINRKRYDYEEGIYYMDIIAESERLGDYVVNIIDDVKSLSDCPDDSL